MRESEERTGRLEEKAYAEIKHYYGEVLQTKDDLKTSACCTQEAMPEAIRPLLKGLHPEILERFYGCGSPFPEAIEERVILDLGCGTGRDVYLLSKLVGPRGRVIGVDMTEAQLSIAQKHVEFHTQAYGYERPNVHFLQGYMEDLASLGIEGASVDIVISNCVLNLSPQKERVFSEIFRVLKPGGELFFSDVFADRRIPPPLCEDPVLRGECLGGAMYTEDFRRLLSGVGCADFRVTASSAITLHDASIRRKLGEIRFSSKTIRAFKLPFEDRCEDYGQIALYQGTIASCPSAFVLDDHHRLEAHKPLLVCGNTADMLSKTRFAPHFRILGDRERHFGLFPCAPAPAVSASGISQGGGCC